MPKQSFYFVFLQEVAAWRALLIKLIKFVSRERGSSDWIFRNLQKISAITTSDLQKQIACYYRAYILLEKTRFSFKLTFSLIQVNPS